MQHLPEALAAKLAAGATTLAWGWRVTLADGAVLGFTDHDRDLVSGGVTYRAGSARIEGGLEAETGFAGGSAAFAGCLDHALIDEADIASGRFDDAQVAVLRLDWTDPETAIVLFSGRLGEVRRGEAGFVAELRGPGAALERTIARTISRRCDAELGEPRCGVDLDDPGFTVAGVVTARLSARRFEASGVEAADDWLTGGVLTWTLGAALGGRARVLEHRTGEASCVIELIEAPNPPIAVGDAFTARVGCDKRWRTCRDRFSNLANFQGFPMIPGDDWTLSPVRPGDRADGGSIGLGDEA